MLCLKLFPLSSGTYNHVPHQMPTQVTSQGVSLITQSFFWSHKRRHASSSTLAHAVMCPKTCAESLMCKISCVLNCFCCSNHKTLHLFVTFTVHGKFKDLTRMCLVQLQLKDKVNTDFVPASTSLHQPLQGLSCIRYVLLNEHPFSQLVHAGKDHHGVPPGPPTQGP